MSKPTEVQANLMQQFFAADAPNLTLEEIQEKFEIQNFVVADNLVNHGQGKFSVDSLMAMPDMLPGLKVMCDHDWGEVRKTIGVIFDANFKIINESPPDWVLKAGGEKNVNLEIISQEGYATVEISAYFRKEKADVLENFRWGEWSWVSVGLVNYHDIKDCRCPECDIKLSDPKCPHYLKGSYLAEEDSPLISYFVLPLVKSIGEVSIVFKGMLPAASLKLKRK